MQPRTTLILFLTAGLLGLVVLLPRTPLVLDWLWSQAGRIAQEQGLQLTADSIAGNAWGGVTLGGLRVSGTGLELSSREIRVEYGLLGLLRGRLSLAVEAEGITGTIDPVRPDTGAGPGSGGVPLDLHHLNLKDVELRVAEHELVLPQITVTDLEARTEGGALRFSGAAGTPDGAVAFAGIWDMRDGELTADVKDADIRLVRYWWDGADSGQFSGRVTVSDRGVDVDGFVRDGAVSVIDTRVTDIRGPVTMRDLIVRAELAGNALGGPVGASVTVDIGAETYRGTLTGNPDVGAALHWLGDSTGVDLSSIEAEGPMALHAVVGGWEETGVIGTANGHGTLAGLPLAQLTGDFSFRSGTGTAVSVAGLLAGGSIGVRLEPLEPGASDLSVSLNGLEPAAGLSLDGDASVQFRPEGEATQSTISATLRSDTGLPGLKLQAVAASSDNKVWPVTVSGGTGTDTEVMGQLVLDLAEDTVGGELVVTDLLVPGLPWPLSGTLGVSGAEPVLPLPFRAEAEAGPLSGAFDLLLSGTGHLEITDVTETLRLTSGPPSTLNAEDVTLLLTLPGRDAMPLSVSAAWAGGQKADATVKLGTLALDLQTGPAGLSAALTGDSGTAVFRPGTTPETWELSGNPPLAELGDLFGLELSGELPLDFTGSGTRLLSGSARGQFTIAGQSVQVDASAADGGLQLTGSTSLLGTDWALDGSWQDGDGPRLHAQSSAGSLTLDGDAISGEGSLPLPAGIRLGAPGDETPGTTLPWKLTGSLQDRLAGLEPAGAGRLTLSFADGTPELGGSVRLTGTAADTPFVLEAAAAAGGGLEGTLRAADAELAFSISGDLTAATAAGTVPAAFLLPELAGSASLEAAFSPADQLLRADFSWLDLTGNLSWQPGREPRLHASAPGLDLSLEGSTLSAEFSSFDAAPFLQATAGTELNVTGSAGGALPAMRVDLAVGSPLFSAALQGRAGPEELALRFEAATPDYGLTAQGTIAGAPADPEVTARLSVPAAGAHGLAETDSIGLDVTRQPGGDLRMTGEGTDVHFGAGGWHGEALLPVSVFSSGHELAVSLSGTEPLPAADAQITGPLLNGTLALRSEVTADLTFAGATAGIPVTAALSGSLALDGSWHARLDGTLEADTPLPAPVTVGAELNGSVADFTGHGNIRTGSAAARLLSFTAQGGADGIELTADLASLDGSAVLHAAGVKDADAHLALTGSARLLLAAGAAPVLELEGQAAAALGDVETGFSFAFADGNLEAEGSAAGQPLRLSYTAADGIFRALWSDLRLEADTAADRLTGTLTGKAGPGGPAADLHFDVALGDGVQPELLSGTIGPAALDLSSAGAGALTGTITLGSLPEPLPLTLTTAPTPALKSTYAGLRLGATLNDGSLLVTITGSADAVPLTANLAWEAGSGFSGTLSASGKLPRTAGDLSWWFSADAGPDGNLALNGELGQPEQAAASTRLVELQATLAADPFRAGALGGHVNARVSPGRFLPEVFRRSLTLSASGRLSGSLAAPSLGGSVIAVGAVEAAGRFGADAAGAWLGLTGSGVDLSFASDWRTWSGTLDLAALPLPELAQLWPGAELGAAIQGSGSFSAASHTATADSVTLSSSDRSIVAEGRLKDGEISGTVRLDWPAGGLTDSVIPAEASAGGTLSISGLIPGAWDTGSLGGEISVGLAPWAGQVSLGGTPAAPRLEADLRNPAAPGHLSALWEPARRNLRLEADLETAGIGADVLLSVRDGKTTVATGRIDVPGGSVHLGSNEDGTLLLEGRSGLSGWGAAFRPAALTATLQGPLLALSEQVEGSLLLEASLKDGRPLLNGSVSGFGLFGVPLGTVNVRGRTSGGGGVDITGDGLEGRVLLNGDWELTRASLQLTPSIRLAASATGNLAGGSLDVSLAGDLLGLPLLADAHAELNGGRLVVDGSFSALEGAGSIEAQLSRGQWRGTVTADGLRYGSFVMSAGGGVFGTATEPRVELQTNGKFLTLTGEGSLRAGPGDLSFHQVLSSPETGTFTVQGAAAPTFSLRLTGPDGHSFRLRETTTEDSDGGSGAELQADGRFNLSSDSGALGLVAGNDGRSADLYLELALLPGFAVQGSLPVGSFMDLTAALEGGVSLQGRGGTLGSLRLDLAAGRFDLHDFGLETGFGTITLDGSAGLDGQARLSGQLLPEAAWLRDLPVLAGETVIPFAVIGSAGTVRLVSYSQLGDLEARYSRASGQAELTGQLRSGGNAAISLAWSERSGLSGSFSAADFVLFELPGGHPGFLNGSAGAAGGLLDVTADLAVGGGEVTARGNLSLSRFLPAWLAGPERAGGVLDLRMTSFEVAGFPPAARLTPGLQGSVTAAVQVRDDVIAGNVVAANLRAGSTPLPVEAVLSGSPRGLELAGNMAGSPVTARLTGGAVSGLFELRRFPFHALLEAVAGELDASTDVTGVLRYHVPLGNPAAAEVRLATEQIVLERDGVTSTGELSFEFSSGMLEVHEASFRGAGSWDASGVMRADALDFTLEARDADFGLLLGLLPGLSRLDLSARGDLFLQADGTPAEPRVSLTSGGIDLSLAGISYRLADLALELRQADLTATAVLSALEPFTGSLTFDGAAVLTAEGLTDAAFRLDGSATLPFVGRVDGINGSIRNAESGPGEPLVADIRARLGQEVRLTGSVWPLDVRLEGTGLQLSLPAVLLAESRLDADLYLQHRAGDGLVLGGDVLIHEGQLRLGAGGGTDQQPSGTASEVVRFDGLRVRAPSRLRLAESFLNVEMSADLRVDGTAAEPLLSGRADALRGTFQFSGRAFELQEAAALFDPARGPYPELQLAAVTSFDRNRLLPASSNLQLVSPTEGTATVNLSFNGTVEPDPVKGIRLDLTPVLTSNITVRSVRDDGIATAPRPLSEDELLALVTLGRAELAALGGESGLAPLVARGALETAVDVFILAELQRALGEALGLDLVEIRSSTLSSLLSGNGEDSQFGISLRFGGYLSDDVFATYSVSAYDDPLGLYSFSNEVGIRYALGPVLLEMAGALKLPEQPGLSAVAQLSLGVDYELSSSTMLRAGFDLSGESQQFSFGVTWRW